MVHRRIRLANVEWFVTDVGNGPVVLLVHGFPLDHTMWSGQMAYLAPRFRVIAPDLRGFGKSPLPPGAPSVVTMAQFADDLAKLLDELQIDQPITWLGLSMGGYIGWEFIRRHGQRLVRAIMADTRAIADSPEMAKGRQLMADRVLREGTAPLAESMLPRLFAPQVLATNPALVEKIRQCILANSPSGMAAALRGMAQRRDVRAELAEIDLPMLLLCGEYDAISSVTEMAEIARQLPAASFRIIPAAGHLAPLENPQATNPILEEFLRS